MIIYPNTVVAPNLSADRYFERTGRQRRSLRHDPLARGGRIERKRAMAYPLSHASGHAAGSSFGSSSGNQGYRRCQTSSPSEGEHQLEKLEFALAVALTRGDLQRSEQLRHAIAALGGNQEEPGT